MTSGLWWSAAGSTAAAMSWPISPASCRPMAGAAGRSMPTISIRADRLVAETNFGGAMVSQVIKTCDATVAYKEVKASRGKVARAEPVAALFEQGRMSLVGGFPELEDEMVLMTSTGYVGDKSPNRVDALVWAVTECMLAYMTPKADDGPVWIPGLSNAFSR